MFKFTLSRLLLALPILVGVSIVVFITVKIIPGNAVDALLGANATPDARAALIARLGLDKGPVEQYFTWIAHALQGDLGMSVANQLPALVLVVDAFRNTLILAGFSAVLAIVLGLAMGAIAAFSPSKILNSILDGVALVFVSVPAYTFGLILIVYLAVGAGMFPTAGMAAPGADLGDWLLHLALPGFTAALVPAGLLARVFRTSLREVLAMEFVEAYRARGIGRMKVAWHAVHNCLPTLLTVAGLQVGYLLSGVVFVETIFSWPGIGQLVYQSITKRDLAVIQAGVMISALAFVLVNLAVDIARGAIDPRVRKA